MDSTLFAPPFFPLYVSEWLTSLPFTLLSLEGKGVLFQLMLWCWRQKSVPSDPAAIMQICRISGGVGDSSAIADAIASVKQGWFTPDPSREGYMVMPALEQLRAAQCEKHASYADRGRRGMQVRWQQAESAAPPPRTVGGGSDSSAIAGGIADGGASYSYPIASQISDIRDANTDAVVVPTYVGGATPPTLASHSQPAVHPHQKSAAPKPQPDPVWEALGQRRDVVKLRELWSKLPKERRKRFAQVVEVYDGWRLDPWMCGSADTAVLTEKRYRKIHDRLAAFSVSELLIVYTGVYHDPHYQVHSHFRDPVTIFRDDEQVYKFQRLAEEGPPDEHRKPTRQRGHTGTGTDWGGVLEDG